MEIRKLFAQIMFLTIVLYKGVCIVCMRMCIYIYIHTSSYAGLYQD